jgi:DNA-binding transcriptional MerR regulator
MKMSKKKFRIGALAHKLSIESFVIRFWEQEFQLNANRSAGRQRYYDEDDLKKFHLIKDLLYSKKFTIAGAKKELQEHLAPADKTAKEKKAIRHAQGLNITGALSNTQAFNDLQAENKHLSQQIALLQNNLKKLKELL